MTYPTLSTTLRKAWADIEAASTSAEVGDLYLAARSAFYAADDARGVTAIERETWRCVMTAADVTSRKLARPIEPLVVLA